MAANSPPRNQTAKSAARSVTAKAIWPPAVEEVFNICHQTLKSGGRIGNWNISKFGLLFERSGHCHWPNQNCHYWMFIIDTCLPPAEFIDSPSPLSVMELVKSNQRSAGHTMAPADIRTKIPKKWSLKKTKKIPCWFMRPRIGPPWTKQPTIEQITTICQWKEQSLFIIKSQQ